MSRRLENPTSSRESRIANDEMESREQFGDRALQAAQEVYADELQTLEEKASYYEKLRLLAFAVGLPGALYIVGKFFGVDMEKITELNISGNTDMLIQLSWAIPMLGGSCAGFVANHFEKKLDYLKNKFGVLEK